MNVSASDIRQYMICPRIVYFREGDRDRWEMIDERFVKHLFIKEISLDDLLYSIDWEDRETIEQLLLKSLVKSEDRIKEIYKDGLKNIDQEIICTAKEDVKREIKKIAERLWNRLNTDGLLIKQLMTPIEVERRIYLDRLGLHGIIDKIVIFNDEEIPNIVKTGNSPSISIWKEDRAQLTAYIMLLEEETGRIISKGVVEYFRCGRPVLVEINRYDRRLVLNIKEKIKKIRRGRLPEREDRVFCEHCIYKDECIVTRSLLSKFF
ncbi:MAG: Dna2/Cas4 domain-containing protein [Candidatus Methanoliparum thermophilum]|uniref:Dna2/Cas4 domain-containing protein n=1 Tax=Methanoliparum thermophilum TaxID=2491083 RepID=A0A520KU46_METT2|nr:Dna2/Cas4 domain-containing protein [Candidatus Methanoliparum sp. LAM-1]RZN65436.1 MAG: Dna2/Cas4 domain-containing protein [Candidatus Methanoliparum thermophilum]BDC35475.1 hypothetical protein MTLP_01570 [Candidatus Methanoliparum sp. LAM-1]